MEVRTRFAGILVLVLLPLSACALEQDPVIVTRPPFPGVYRLESAAGERLPAPVSTAWLEGQELWRGQRVGSSVVIRNVQAIELEFLWIGPWTRPA